MRSSLDCLPKRVSVETRIEIGGGLRGRTIEKQMYRYFYAA